MNRKESAANHFASNAMHKEYHVTSDGLCFEREEVARAHANTLKEKSIERFKRDDLKKEIAVALDETKGAKGKKGE
jgi:hypothetical protein